MEVSEIVLQFRARLAGTQHLVRLLSTTRDCRVRRIIELLNDVSRYGELVPPCAEEIIQICTDDPMRYRGLHPRLLLLKDELSTATDFIIESSRRILLYLEHISITGSKLPEATRMLTQSTVREQMEMVTSLHQKAHSATTSALVKPPGPAPMPYDDHEEITTAQPSMRGLINGKPAPIGEDYDARYDPDVKMPGTLHGKFLTLPGPFFAPETTKAAFDHFCVSETIADLLDNFSRKYSDCADNFKDTRRAQSDEDTAMLEALEEVCHTTALFITPTNSRLFSTLALNSQRKAIMTLTPYAYVPLSSKLPITS